MAGYSYYLTIVTHQRKAILVENTELLRESFRESRRYYKYKIDAIVVLPDHIHMIITPEKSTEYPKIVHAIKYNFSKRFSLEEGIEQSSSRYRRKIKPVWQKRYYEHTIRDEKDWLKTLTYMQHNPIKHGLVEDIKDWKYSSFA